MRVITNDVPRAVIFATIAFFGVLNLALYGGVFKGEDAINITTFVELPDGNAPGVELSAAQRAELDDSSELPGEFVPNQGRRHTNAWPLDERVPFCEQGERSSDCYASNPPTSGLHLPVVRGAELPGGNRIDLPPPPGVYDFEFPREAIPHMQEHAMVFFGFNCAGLDCALAVERAKQIVAEELALGARVVMAPLSDLEPDTLALASWTRIDSFVVSEFSEARVRDFIKAHSCRFDPEGFCTDRADQAVN